MALSESILPEFDHEMANTRKTLERVPDDKFDWRPHFKSGTMGWLAAHLANLPGWVSFTLEQDSLDIAPAGGTTAPAQPKTAKELLQAFDKNVAAARTAISRASDAELTQPWTLMAGQHKVFTLPRVAVLRSFVMNHTIHHRAQLGVYLRLNDIPVPAIYGPSADEGGF